MSPRQDTMPTQDIHNVEPSAVPEAVTEKRPKASRRGMLVRRLKRSLYSSIEKPRRAYVRTVTEIAARSDRVLDVGCGYTAPVLRELTGESLLKVGTDIVGDLRPDEAPGICLVQADCGRLPFDAATFDLVICRSVLEHLVQPLEVFQEISRVLRPGGSFVFLTPNRWDYVSLGASMIPNRYHGTLVRLLTGRNEEDTFPTVYGANSVRRIRRLADCSGMKVSSVQLLREHPHYLQFNSGTYLLGVVYEQLIQRFVNNTRPWILGLCRRSEN